MGDEAVAKVHRDTRALVKKYGFQWSWSILRAILLAGISFIILYPLFTKITMSFMETRDLYDMSVRFIPKHFTLDNYRIMWAFMDMPLSFINSALLCLMVGLCQTAACTIVAYGFARYPYRGSRFVFALVIVSMVIPPDLLLSPLYLQFKNFDIFGFFQILTGGKTVDLINTHVPFILLGLTGMGLKNGLYIFLMRQFFLGSPKELEEAAWVDGYGPVRCFVRIMLPGAVPMMVTIFLFSFVWQFLDGLYASVFMPNVNTMISALTNLGNVNYMLNLGVTNMATATLCRYAGVVALVIPLLLLYILTQRFFTESIERSGLVG